MQWLHSMFDLNRDGVASFMESFFEAFAVGLVSVLLVAIVKVSHLWLMN